MSLQDSNLARSLMNLVEILMKDIPAEENKYMKSWLIVSFVCFVPPDAFSGNTMVMIVWCVLLIAVIVHVCLGVVSWRLCGYRQSSQI